MVYTNRKEISELDDKIDQRIPIFPLLSRSKDQALFHALLGFEDWMDVLGHDPDLNTRSNKYKKVYSALNHIIQWIHQYCRVESSKEIPSVDPKTDDETMPLFTEAIEYGDLWVQMTLCFRERTHCRRLTQNNFAFSSKSLQNREMDTARMIMDNAKNPQSFEDAFDISHETWLYVKNKLSITSKKGTNIKYSFSPDVFSILIKAVDQRALQKWSMDPEWNLGGYTFKELKKFWLTLKALGIIHNIAVQTLSNEQKRRNLKIKIRSINEWITELSQWSNLPRNIVRTIIEDMIYDPALYKQGRQKPHVLFQPFFCFENGNLGVSNMIVQISNIERNAWHLVSIIRPDISNALKNQKESFWIQNFKQKIEDLGLKCFSNIKFKFEGNNGEIDLLIIDDSIKFGLVCELKWLTSSDDPKGVEIDDEQMTKGIRQAERGLSWIQSNVSVLARRIGIEAGNLKEIDFKPLVISKESLPSGFIGKSTVPIINQILFDWITDEPHHKDIFSLWKVASNMSYLPKLGEHYRAINTTIQWGEMRFLLKGLAFESIKPWNPQKDISF